MKKHKKSGEVQICNRVSRKAYNVLKQNGEVI